MAVFQMGQRTLSVPMSMFAENRTKLVNAIKETKTVACSAIVLLKGGESLNLYDTDVEYVFRQESYFTWMFGAKEPGLFGAVQISSGKSLLFVPRLPEEYAVWLGPLLTLQEFKKMYEVDEVHYVDQLRDVLKALNPATLLTLSGVNSDSGLTAQEAVFDGISEFKVNNEFLFNIIAECRVIKSAKELSVMRYVCKVSSDAHKQVMLKAAAGVSEYECESVFLAYCYGEGGCRHVSYTCICGSGPNSAILHYGHAAAPNDRTLRAGDMVLFDMGANYAGYAADITCSFPISGKFTDDQKIVYNAVLAARDAVIAAGKPGVSWVAMHDLSLRTMFTALKCGGLLQGCVNEMIQAGLAGTFMPHGLGHLLGLDVHDVGGYLNTMPTRPTEPGFNRLRTARVLQAGMCLTVEPGCYFIDPLLDEALANPAKSKFLVPDVVNRFRGFGGVRIEDDVIVTETGMENMTFVPRTVEEIESWMAQRN